MARFVWVVKNYGGVDLAEFVKELYEHLAVKVDSDGGVSLFDGYKLTHEKQYELEREVSAPKEMMEALSLRLMALESKGA